MIYFCSLAYFSVVCYDLNPWAQGQALRVFISQKHSMFPLHLKPSQARASNQCRASNRQTRASNNHNALRMNVIIVAFLENATIGYSLESLCVCVFVCVCVCVCVFLHDNSKRTRSRNTKSEYNVVDENSLDKFDIELHRIKVKVTVGVQKFSPFTTIQTVRSYSSTLVQARKLILSSYLHLILIYKIYECCHA